MLMINSNELSRVSQCQAWTLKCICMCVKKLNSHYTMQHCLMPLKYSSSYWYKRSWVSGIFFVTELCLLLLKTKILTPVLCCWWWPFFYATVPLDETKIYLVILPTNPFGEFESDSSSHWYSGISNCESVLPKYLFIGDFVGANLSIAAGISEHL